MGEEKGSGSPVSGRGIAAGCGGGWRRARGRTDGTGTAPPPKDSLPIERQMASKVRNIMPKRPIGVSTFRSWNLAGRLVECATRSRVRCLLFLGSMCRRCLVHTACAFRSLERCQSVRSTGYSTSSASFGAAGHDGASSRLNVVLNDDLYSISPSPLVPTLPRFTHRTVSLLSARWSTTG